ncbi:MAG: hypothetical protein Kow0037_04700 [Calditrichia bacterium]
MKKRQLTSLQMITVRWWNATAYYAIELARALQSIGNPTIIVSQPGSPPFIRAQEAALPVNEDIDPATVNPVRFLLNIHRLRKLINESNIDVLVPHRAEDHLLAGLATGQGLRRPVIRTIGDVRSPKNNPINRWLHLKKTDCIILSCQKNKERYQEVWPIPDDRCEVILAPVDTGYFSPDHPSSVREELGIPTDETVFGMVARLSPVKDHATFIRAAGQIFRKTGRGHFLISGEEVEVSVQQLKEMAKDHGVADRLHFLPRHPDVREVIQAIDVGIVASKGSEAICRVAGEFFSMKKPVIATTVNVLPEMVRDGHNGFLFEPGDETALARQMELLLNDTSLRKTMGDNARNFAINTLGIPVFLKKTISVYSRVLENQKETK